MRKTTGIRVKAAVLCALILLSFMPARVYSIGYTAPIIIINDNVWASNVAKTELVKSGNSCYITTEAFMQLPYMSIEELPDGGVKLTNGISGKYLIFYRTTMYAQTEENKFMYISVIRGEKLMVEIKATAEYLGVFYEIRERNSEVVAVRLADITSASKLEEILSSIEVTFGEGESPETLRETRIYMAIEVETSREALFLAELLNSYGITALFLLDYEEILSDPLRICGIYANNCAVGLGIVGAAADKTIETAVREAVTKSRRIAVITKFMPMTVSLQYLTELGRNEASGLLAQEGFSSFSTDNGYTSDETMDSDLLLSYLNRRQYQRSDLYFKISSDSFIEFENFISALSSINDTAFYIPN